MYRADVDGGFIFRRGFGSFGFFALHVGLWLALWLGVDLISDGDISEDLTIV